MHGPLPCVEIMIGAPNPAHEKCLRGLGELMDDHDAHRLACVFDDPAHGLRDRRVIALDPPQPDVPKAIAGLRERGSDRERHPTVHDVDERHHGRVAQLGGPDLQLYDVLQGPGEPRAKLPEFGGP